MLLLMATCFFWAEWHTLPHIFLVLGKHLVPCSTNDLISCQCSHISLYLYIDSCMFIFSSTLLSQILLGLQNSPDMTDPGPHVFQLNSPQSFCKCLFALCHMKQCVSVVSIRVLPRLPVLGFSGPAELEETQIDIPEDLFGGKPDSVRLQGFQTGLTL